MRSRSLLLTLCVLNIWFITYAACCGQRQADVDGLCCDLCPPGTYLKEFCSKDRKTVCGACENGTYSSHDSMFDRCEKCQLCQQEYAVKCSPTTNANCSCRPGFLCSNSMCSNCVENKCVIGEVLKMTIKSSNMLKTEYSYHCEPACPDDEYFDVKKKVCKPRTQCIMFGFAVLFPGNKTHNSICDRVSPETYRNDGDFPHVVLGITFVLLTFTLLVVLSYICIKKLKKHKPSSDENPTNIVAVSTNTTDFHLSQEESGLPLILQDESKNSHSLDQLHLEKLNAL